MSYMEAPLLEVLELSRLSVFPQVGSGLVDYVQYSEPTQRSQFLMIQVFVVCKLQLQYPF